MIRYIKGDIFQSPAKVLVNTVNTVGVMGKGIALEYKKRYPRMYEDYKRRCDNKQLRIGKLMLWYGVDHWILNFPTKEHWRSPSKIEYIEAGLKKFSEKYLDFNISSAAFPPLGCGNGGLQWEDVRPLMEKYLDNISADIYIYVSRYESTSHSLKQDWTTKKMKDFSFSGLEENLASNISIVPLSFSKENASWQALWIPNKSQLQLQSDEKGYVIDEDELNGHWDEIRNQSVFIDSNDEQISLIFKFLSSAGYLDEILLKEDGSDEMKLGYQLNWGQNTLYQMEA